VDDREMLSDAARRLPLARANLQRAIGDMPASGQQGGTQGVSDRTGRIALAVLDGTDTAWTDLQHLDALMQSMMLRCNHKKPISRQLAQLIDILDRWAPPPKRRRAIESNLRAAADDMLDRADWNKCVSHRRIPGVAPPETRRQGGKLCRWCEDWLRALTDPDGEWALDLELPPLELVKANAHGMKIDRHIPPRRQRGV